MSTVRFVVLLLSVGGCAAQGPPGTKAIAKTYTIVGTVVDGLSSAPLAGVRVSIASDSPARSETAMVTGVDGRFAFGGAKAGKWQLKAQREGFGLHIYGQSPSGSAPGIAIVTGPETSTDQLVFRMYPPAVITGKVIDEFGEPVGSALVQLFASFVTEGRRRVRGVRTVWSDSNGEYRIWGLPSGAYYAAVSATPWFASQLSKEPGNPLAGMAFEQQFFPGTSDVAAAAAFRLQPGEQHRVDFQLKFIKAVRLSVETSHEETQLILLAPGPQGTQMVVKRTGMAAYHKFDGLAPGSYKLIAVGGVAGRIPRSQQIELGSQDVDMRLNLPDPVSVTCTVHGVDTGPDVLSKLGLSLTSDELVTGDARLVSQGEKMVFQGLTAGRYRLNLFGAWDEIYLDGVTAQGARVELPFIELAEGQSAQLEVTVKGDGGRVSGQVKTAQKFAPGVYVILTPQHDIPGPLSNHLFMTDLDGTFDFTGLKPGEYLLFTSTDPELEYMDRVAMRAYYESATPVHVEPHSSQTIQIDLPQDPASQPAR